MSIPPRPDWDEVSHAVSDAYFPHRLRPLRGTSAARAAADGIDLGPVRIARISWGAPVVVETEHAGGVAVNLPATGGLTSRIGGTEIEASPAVATVYPADTPVTITRWAADCAIVGVRYERDYLAREMARILDHPVAPAPTLSVESASGASWYGLVSSLADYRVGAPIVNERIAGALTTAFVLAVCPEDAISAAQPRIVRRVLDALHDDPARAWTAGDMADVAGVGVRRLQAGFREYLNRSPHEVLADLRLERIRADLVDGADTVAEVANRWGITHLGRFAAAYRARYGEVPSETRRERDRD
jgi:AraC-like DNA-binding protein